VRPNLNLERTAVCVHDDGVQGLIAIGLGPADVVVKLVIHRGEGRMHLGQRLIAVPLLLNQDPKGSQITEGIEGQPLVAHLVADAEEMLGPAAHLGLKPSGGHQLAKMSLGLLHEGLTLGPAFVEPSRNLAIAIGLTEPEGVVLKGPLELPDAQAIGQRGLHAQGLLAEMPALGQAEWIRVLDRALQPHQMLSKPDQDHPEVL